MLLDYLTKLTKEYLEKLYGFVLGDIYPLPDKCKLEGNTFTFEGEFWA